MYLVKQGRGQTKIVDFNQNFIAFCAYSLLLQQGVSKFKSPPLGQNRSQDHSEPSSPQSIPLDTDIIHVTRSPRPSSFVLHTLLDQKNWTVVKAWEQDELKSASPHRLLQPCTTLGSITTSTQLVIPCHRL